MNVLHQHGTVNNNSIQSKFAQLSNERDELRHGCATADRELRRETDLVAKLREKQARLAEETRVAHAAVGEVSKKRKMVAEEIYMLKARMEKDHKSVLQVGKQIEDLEVEERNSKEMFVKEMDVLNKDMEVSISTLEEHNIMKLLLASPDDGGVEILQEKVEQLTNEDLRKEIQNSLKIYGNAVKSCGDVIRKKEKDEQALQKMRRIALSRTATTGIGQLELDELEHVWVEQGRIKREKNNSNASNPRDQLESETHDDVHTSEFVACNQPTTANMDLFYSVD